MNESGLRHRGKGSKQIISNKIPNNDKELKVEEFVERESTLSVLVESSLHFKTIYHIFVNILLILFCDSIIFGLVDRGKINIGQTEISRGFGDIRRGIKLWMYEFIVVLLFYPLLLMYSWFGKLSRKFRVLRYVTTPLGWVGLIGTQILLISVPIYDIATKYLAVASSVAVTVEMFRFMMKITAVAVACGPRCVDGQTPLPTYQHYVYFLFAPTLLYRDQYPRTKKIRWSKVLFHLAEWFTTIFYYGFLWTRLIMPHWSDYGKQSKVEAGTVVRGIFASVIPGVLCFVSGFYGVLHAWQNVWAEMLKFGDRLFYEDWWTASSFSDYYRRWNRLVHSWLRDHIYVPLAPSLGRPMSTFIVFLVSSAAHELVISLSFGFFYPIMLVQFGVLGLLFVPLTAAAGRRYPHTLNLVMWFGFFIGNGLLWSLYPMEYFARLNCPPSENDSFFIPKSWSCPEVVLRPGWTFENPFNVFS